MLIAACAAALGVMPTVGVRAHTEPVTPPPVPANIQVPPGNNVFLVGHGVATQNYVCGPSTTSPTGVAFSLFTPQATLFDDEGDQLTTHFFSPNPSEGNTIRATWEDSRDTSMVWGFVLQQSSDPNFVRPDSIAWLLVKQSGVAQGPTGGDRLTKTTFIQRLNTVGGLAPSSGCSGFEDVGRKAFVPYEADYFFYRSAHNR
jgi:hypothetical protein